MDFGPIQQHRFQQFLTLLLGLLICVFVVRAQFIRRQQSGAYASMSAPQLLFRSRSICRTILPDADQMNFAADLDPYSNRSIKPDYWIVTAQDKDNNRKASLFWDARTGDLKSVINEETWQDTVPGAPISAQTAGILALRWLYRIGVATHAPEWHIESKPQCIRKTYWYVPLHDGDRIARIKLGIHSGKFLEADLCGSLP